MYNIYLKDKLPLLLQTLIKPISPVPPAKKGIICKFATGFLILQGCHSNDSLSGIFTIF